MPTYKELSSNKKTQPKKADVLPWYSVPENWFSVATPVAILLLVVIAVYGAVKMYRGSVADKSSALVSAPGIDAAGLEGVVKKYPKSDAAAVARVKLGKQALDQSRWDDAIAWYAPVADDRSSPALLRVTAYTMKPWPISKKMTPRRP